MQSTISSRETVAPTSERHRRIRRPLRRSRKAPERVENDNTNSINNNDDNIKTATMQTSEPGHADKTRINEAELRRRMTVMRANAQWRGKEDAMKLTVEMQRRQTERECEEHEVHKREQIIQSSYAPHVHEYLTKVIAQSKKDPMLRGIRGNDVDGVATISAMKNDEEGVLDDHITSLLLNNKITNFDQDAVITSLITNGKANFLSIDHHLSEDHTLATEHLHSAVFTHANDFLALFRDVARASELVEKLKSSVQNTKSAIASISKFSYADLGGVYGSTMNGNVHNSYATPVMSPSRSSVDSAGYYRGNIYQNSNRNNYNVNNMKLSQWQSLSQGRKWSSSHRHATLPFSTLSSEQLHGWGNELTYYYEHQQQIQSDYTHSHDRQARPSLISCKSQLRRSSQYFTQAENSVYVGGSSNASKSNIFSFGNVNSLLWASSSSSLNQNSNSTSAINTEAVRKEKEFHFSRVVGATTRSLNVASVHLWRYAINGSRTNLHYHDTTTTNNNDNSSKDEGNDSSRSEQRGEHHNNERATSTNQNKRKHFSQEKEEKEKLAVPVHSKSAITHSENSDSVEESELRVFVDVLRDETEQLVFERRHRDAAELLQSIAPEANAKGCVPLLLELETALIEAVMGNLHHLPMAPLYAESIHVPLLQLLMHFGRRRSAAAAFIHLQSNWLLSELGKLQERVNPRHASRIAVEFLVRVMQSVLWRQHTLGLSKVEAEAENEAWELQHRTSAFETRSRFARASNTFMKHPSTFSTKHTTENGTSEMRSKELLIPPNSAALLWVRSHILHFASHILATHVLSRGGTHDAADASRIQRAVMEMKEAIVILSQMSSSGFAACESLTLRELIPSLALLEGEYVHATCNKMDRFYATMMEQLCGSVSYMYETNGAAYNTTRCADVARRVNVKNQEMCHVIQHFSVNGFMWLTQLILAPALACSWAEQHIKQSHFSYDVQTYQKLEEEEQHQQQEQVEHYRSWEHKEKLAEKNSTLSEFGNTEDTFESNASVNKYYHFNQQTINSSPLSGINRNSKADADLNRSTTNSNSIIHHVPNLYNNTSNTRANGIRRYTGAHSCFALTPEQYRFFRYANGCSTVNVLLIESIIKLIAAMIGRDKLPAQTKRSKRHTNYTHNTRTSTNTQMRHNNIVNNNVSSSSSSDSTRYSASLSALNRTRNIDSMYELNSNEPIQVGWNRLQKSNSEREIGSPSSNNVAKTNLQITCFASSSTLLLSNALISESLDHTLQRLIDCFLCTLTQQRHFLLSFLASPSFVASYARMRKKYGKQLHMSKFDCQTWNVREGNASSTCVFSASQTIPNDDNINKGNINSSNICSSSSSKSNSDTLMKTVPPTSPSLSVSSPEASSSRIENEIRNLHNMTWPLFANPCHSPAWVLDSLLVILSDVISAGVWVTFLTHGSALASLLFNSSLIFRTEYLAKLCTKIPHMVQTWLTTTIALGFDVSSAVELQSALTSEETERTQIFQEVPTSTLQSETEQQMQSAEKAQQSTEKHYQQQQHEPQRHIRQNSSNVAHDEWARALSRNASFRGARSLIDAPRHTINNNDNNNNPNRYFHEQQNAEIKQDAPLHRQTTSSTMLPEISEPPSLSASSSFTYLHTRNASSNTFGGFTINEINNSSNDSRDNNALMSVKIKRYSQHAGVTSAQTDNKNNAYNTTSTVSKDMKTNNNFVEQSYSEVYRQSLARFMMQLISQPYKTPAKYRAQLFAVDNMYMLQTNHVSNSSSTCSNSDKSSMPNNISDNTTNAGYNYKNDNVDCVFIVRSIISTYTPYLFGDAFDINYEAFLFHWHTQIALHLLSTLQERLLTPSFVMNRRAAETDRKLEEEESLSKINGEYISPNTNSVNTNSKCNNVNSRNNCNVALHGCVCPQEDFPLSILAAGGGNYVSAIALLQFIVFRLLQDVLCNMDTWNRVYHNLLKDWLSNEAVLRQQLFFFALFMRFWSPLFSFHSVYNNNDNTSNNSNTNAATMFTTEASSRQPNSTSALSILQFLTCHTVASLMEHKPQAANEIGKCNFSQSKNWHNAPFAHSNTNLEGDNFSTSGKSNTFTTTTTTTTKLEIASRKSISWCAPILLSTVERFFTTDVKETRAMKAITSELMKNRVDRAMTNINLRDFAHDTTTPCTNNVSNCQSSANSVSQSLTSILTNSSQNNSQNSDQSNCDLTLMQLHQLLIHYVRPLGYVEENVTDIKEDNGEKFAIYKFNKKDGINLITHTSKRYIVQ